MANDLAADGWGYRLRPAHPADAKFILELRAEPGRGQFINSIRGGIEAERDWLESQAQRAGDYYFVIERRTTHSPEGTVGLYGLDQQGGSAEWGRWIVRSDSLAASESAYLIYEIGFARLGLSSMYCRTLVENKKVISFHESCGLQLRAAVTVVVDGVDRQAVEHWIDRSSWPAARRRLGDVAKKLAARLDSDEQHVRS